tara:strand:+ start:1485 stop:2453 length:969 start_codon:yes stop_codon:yes gene_type:complete
MTELLEFVSQSLGDNIAWSPYCYEYSKLTGRKVVVKTRWAELFDDIEDKVKFYPCQTIHQFHVTKESHPNGLPEVLGKGPDGEFNVDWRSQIVKSGMGQIDNLKKINFHLNRKVNIQKQICDQLQIPFKQIIPTISTKSTEGYKTPRSKYVCISVQSTSKCKLWTQSGWDKVVRFLKTKGYKVLCIDKDDSWGRPNDWNLIPKKAINETGSFPLEKRIKQIMDCDFFIGLSSGLSWLAWALGKKVVMISGSTHKINEFDCFRVQNESVCHGCLNDEDLNSFEEIQYNWAYCPRGNKHECRTKISFDAVKEQITKCINTKKQG